MRRVREKTPFEAKKEIRASPSPLRDAPAAKAAGPFLITGQPDVIATLPMCELCILIPTIELRSGRLPNRDPLSHRANMAVWRQRLLPEQYGKSNFGTATSAFDPTETLAVHCATVFKPVSALSEYSF
jgi:hypothetical protein